MKYFAIIDGEQKGPYTLEELHAAGVTPETYIWCKEMPDWRQASEVGDVCRYFRQHLSGTLPKRDGTAATVTSEAEDSRQEIFPELPEAGYRDDNIEEAPRNILIYAVLATIFCCPVSGIMAILFSIRTNRLWKEGKKEESHDAFRKARLWTGVTFFLGFFIVAALMRLL